MKLTRAWAVMLLALPAWAQNGSQFRDWEPALAGPSTARPKIHCADLRSLTGYGFSVAAAVATPGSADAPEFCRVTGLVMPAIQFEISLPAQWNQRFYMFGNGGFAGEKLDSRGRLSHRNKALAHGFAVAQMNTGHDAATDTAPGAFAMDIQKLYDYAFRSLHVTAESAKTLIRAFYGEAPVRSYFDGCSTGGRQALILAQRFPDDFDGIIVGAPVLNFSGTMLKYVEMALALEAGPVPLAKVKLVADRVYALCDAKDGVRDGVIDDPRRCDFDPARDLPKCVGEAGGAGCFTARQIASLKAIYADVSAGGRRLFPGWPVGAEAAGPNGHSGWENWIVRDSGQTISVGFALGFFRYMAYPEKDPGWTMDKFDFDKDPARLEAIHEVLDATDPDLARFRDRGGKMIMYYGWADPALNPRMGVEYYEQVREKMGASTSNFFRLFMVPGMFHCAGGVGTGTFDCMTALARWVEKGVAPNRIAAARISQGKTVRTRPLCPYPQVAHYTGAGSTDDAANFVCAAPAIH